MKAEQYLNRIENKGISDTLTYSRKEMIDFAERYAEQCNIHRIGKCFSEVEMQKEYEKGFNDGNQRDFAI